MFMPHSRTFANKTKTKMAGEERSSVLARTRESISFRVLCTSMHCRHRGHRAHHTSLRSMQLFLPIPERLPIRSFKACCPRSVQITGSESLRRGDHRQVSSQSVTLLSMTFADRRFVDSPIASRLSAVLALLWLVSLPSL